MERFSSISERFYFEERRGRNKNYLRPEDIEKIVTVFEERREIPKYSRIVDIKEIEENEFNLNIRRYVDISPDPEPEDVHAHLIGGIPKREVSLYEEFFSKFGISYELFLKSKNQDYLEFNETVEDKDKIREIIDSNPDVNETFTEIQ